MSSNGAIVYKLETVLEKVIDNRGKNPPFSMAGVPYIDTTCIVGNNRYPDYSLIRKYVSEETYGSWFRSGHPKKNDLLIATVGANIGKICLMDETKACIAQNTIGLRVNNEKAHPCYLYYLLTSKSYQDYLKSLDVGSAQPSIKVPHLLNIDIDIPSLTVQSKIAKFLSDLDEKIELNRQTIRTLEALAQAIYKEWFVNFNFPGCTGEMHDAELGPIPKGWRIGFIGDEDITTITKPGIEEFEGEKIYLDTASVKNSEIVDTTTRITLSKRPSRANMQPKPNTVWFAKMKDSKKILFFDTFSRWDIKRFILSTGFAGLDVKDYALYYVWAFISVDRFEIEKDNLCHGTTMQAINNDNIKRIKMLIPRKDILQKYNELMKPKYEQIFVLSKNIETLVELRNFLLPKLMSGEIEV